MLLSFSMRPDKNTGLDEQTGILRYGQPSFALHHDISEFFYLSVPTKYRYKFTDTRTKHTNKDALHSRVKNQWQQNIQPHYRVNYKSTFSLKEFDLIKVFLPFRP